MLTQHREHSLPKLTSEQIRRISSYAEMWELSTGTGLFHQGDTRVSMFVVLSGEIAILQGDTELETISGPGGFTGEMNTLSGGGSLLSAAMKTDGRVLVVSHENLRRIVQADPELSDLLMKTFIMRRIELIRQHHGEVLLIGSVDSAHTMQLRDFLSHTGQPYSFVDILQDTQSKDIMRHLGVDAEDTPVVLCPGERILIRPSNRELAKCLGLDVYDPSQIYDTIIVGAGPAGLAAAVYGASEGLKVLLVEANAPGGQASFSSKIENYLGFPTGISGKALADRASTQAVKFGADLVVANGAIGLDVSDHPYGVVLMDGTTVRGKTVVVSSGVQYRKLPNVDLTRYEGAGVHYGATNIEAQLCQGEEVVIVGGGNSAGQAAMYLSKKARHVHILVRGSGLSDTMSHYLIQRIDVSPLITVHPHSQLEILEGEKRLEKIGFVKNGKVWKMRVGHLFIMTGASPNTGWLDGQVETRDGFILTEEVGRSQYSLETSMPGIFAVGDVRYGSTKRVATAVGEGSACISQVHKVLAEF